MKKIAVLLLLCMVLCASSAMALAATVSFNAGIHDNPENVSQGYLSGSMESITAAVGEKVSLPECGYSVTDKLNNVFFSWRVKLGNQYYYLRPGDKLTVTGDMNIAAHWVYPYTVAVVYKPGRGAGEDRLFPEDSGSHQLYGMDSLRFDPPMKDGKAEKFIGWLVVEGKCDVLPDDYGPGLGWLFARAIADENLRQPNTTLIIEKGPLVLEAQWGEGSGSGGGQAGGNGGVNGGVGEAASMPGTGDSSLPMAFLMLMLAASVGGIALLAKRRTN